MTRPLSAVEQVSFDHVERETVARARVVVVPFLFPGVAGMSLGRFILLRRGREHDAQLIAHELAHAEQWAEHGVIGFLVRYLRAYLRLLLRYRRHSVAYRSIPFERDARRAAARWARDHADRRAA